MCSWEWEANWGIQQLDFEARILTDNQAALQLLSNNSNSQRAKHIDLQYHLSRERVERGEVLFQYCPTSMMIADILTKAVTPVIFSKLRGMMGLPDK
jgi:hypothetical protein